MSELTVCLAPASFKVIGTKNEELPRIPRCFHAGRRRVLVVSVDVPGRAPIVPTPQAAFLPISCKKVTATEERTRVGTIFSSLRALTYATRMMHAVIVLVGKKCVDTYG